MKNFYIQITALVVTNKENIAREIADGLVDLLSEQHPVIEANWWDIEEKGEEE